MATVDPERLLEIIQSQSAISASRLDADHVMDLVTAHARGLTSAAAAVVEVVEGDELVYHAVSGSAEAHRGLRLKLSESLSGRCVAEGELLVCADSETDGRVNRDACRTVEARSLVCVPLRFAGEVVGVLKVYSAEPDAFAADDVDTLRLLTDVIAAKLAACAIEVKHTARRRHDALLLNDAVVEGLAVAQYAAEAGNQALVRQKLPELLASAKGAVERLLIDTPMEAGDLRLGHLTSSSPR